MATDAQSLLTQAQCYLCYAESPQSALLLKLALLRQIVLNQNPIADVSPQTLLASANCYLCYANSPALLMLIELALLNQIAGGGGGGGGGGSGAVLSGNGAPVGAPVTQPAIYIQTDSVPPNQLWVYVNGAWQ